jgi:Protein of unknown function (DUF2924)
MMARRLRPRGAGEDLRRLTPRPKDVLALDDMIAALVELEANGLCLHWRNHLGGTPPAHLPRWLLMKILAYRIQTTTFGGLDKETLRVLRQPKGRMLEALDARPFETRTPIARDGADLRNGALLTRDWNGKLERVMILDQGVAWNGETYGSLSQVAKAMTGTSWNGHRFFGLRTARSDRSAMVPRRSGDCDAALSCRLNTDQRPRSRFRPTISPAGGVAMRSERGKTTLRCALYARVSTEHGLERSSTRSTIKGRHRKPTSKAKLMKAGS